MNLVDWIVISVIGISVLFGLYRGFISSVLNMGCGLISFLSAFAMYPRLAVQIQSDAGLIRTLSHYTDASSRVGDLGLSMTAVSELNPASIESVINRVSLPAPLDSILRVNLEHQVFGANLQVSDYVSQTILQASINIICFIICFIALYAVLSILLNLVRAVFRFPVLKMLDGTAGGVFGLLRGLLITLVLFTLVPLIQTMVPLEFISELLEESALAGAFMNGNLITAIMNGSL